MTATQFSLYRQASRATAPWSGTDTESRDHRLDRQEVSEQEIEVCLECPFPECINCRRYKRHRFAYLAQKKEHT